MTTKKRFGDRRRKFCDLIRFLLQGPKTVTQLLTLADIEDKSLRESLKIAKECGIIYRTGDGVNGYPYVYHLCKVPFEIPDSDEE